MEWTWGPGFGFTIADSHTATQFLVGPSWVCLGRRAVEYWNSMNAHEPHSTSHTSKGRYYLSIWFLLLPRCCCDQFAPIGGEIVLLSRIRMWCVRAVHTIGNQQQQQQQQRKTTLPDRQGGGFALQKLGDFTLWSLETHKSFHFSPKALIAVLSDMH